MIQKLGEMKTEIEESRKTILNTAIYYCKIDGNKLTKFITKLPY
jgi:hypothetical protein